MVSLSDEIIQSLNISEGVPVSEWDILVVLSLPLEQIKLETDRARPLSVAFQIHERGCGGAAQKNSFRQMARVVRVTLGMVDRIRTTQ
jgi:hypothetical protein